MTNKDQISMSSWKVSTQDRKSVEVHQIWFKDNQTIRLINGFRWGTWTLTTEDENPPEFELYACPGGSDDLDSVNMYDCGYERELEDLNDHWHSHIDWPVDMDDGERERLTELWEEKSSDGWEGERWSNIESECWAWGGFDIEKID